MQFMTKWSHGIESKPNPIPFGLHWMGYNVIFINPLDLLGPMDRKQFKGKL